jgi:hypothetical protein
MLKLINRNRSFFLFIAVLTFILSSCSKEEEVVKVQPIRYLAGVYPDSTITDGPFATILGNRLNVRWIEKNRSVVEEIIIGNNDDDFSARFGIPFNYLKSFQNSNVDIDYVQEFSNVENLVALSDIHGQYGVFVTLLKNNKIIDDQNNWIFGSGHLLINGDVFDRGNRVTESLWLIFKLEHQAAALGGKVHLLLGNHEIMVLNNDLRYIDPKYNTNARRLGSNYDQLYSPNTIIGKWLRTKPVIVKINDMVFNHAGISSEFLMRKLNAETVNRLFLEKIIDADSEMIDKDPLLDFLTGSDGPVWHRGYFDDNDFNLTKTNQILNYFNSEHIIVGHTTMEHILFLFDQKIIAIDAGIKYGDAGEVLICKNGAFSVGILE